MKWLRHNDDDKDNNDANSKDVEVVEIDTGEALTTLQKKLTCHHARQIK